MINHVHITPNINKHTLCSRQMQYPSLHLSLREVYHQIGSLSTFKVIRWKHVASLINQEPYTKMKSWCNMPGLYTYYFPFISVVPFCLHMFSINSMTISNQWNDENTRLKKGIRNILPLYKTVKVIFSHATHVYLSLSFQTIQLMERNKLFTMWYAEPKGPHLIGLVSSEWWIEQIHQE